MSEETSTAPIPALDANLSAAVAAIEAEAAVKPATATAAASDYETLVMTWFNASVANSPISRIPEAINYLTQVAIPALVAALSHG